MWFIQFWEVTKEFQTLNSTSSPPRKIDHFSTHKFAACETRRVPCGLIVNILKCCVGCRECTKQHLRWRTKIGWFATFCRICDPFATSSILIASHLILSHLSVRASSDPVSSPPPPCLLAFDQSVREPSSRFLLGLVHVAPLTSIVAIHDLATSWCARAIIMHSRTRGSSRFPSM